MWSVGKTALLPDSSFALVEIKKGKKIRHCPHHDINGKLDEDQLIYILGTFESEIWIDQANREVAEKHLNQHYDKFMTRVMKNELHRPININQAKLTELVTLPRVGPVLAVRIVKYRKSISTFTTIEQIKKVGGIGPATFNAIKFYITVK
jgi:competence ComEA-like helix-hairpin-helix protein